MTLEDKVHGFRLHLFRRAQELGNVKVWRSLRRNRLLQPSGRLDIAAQQAPISPVFWRCRC